MKRIFLLESFCLMLLAASFSGCATIVSGSSQKLTLQSNPPGATVSVDGNIVGTTPVITAIKKSTSQAIVFSKEGFETLRLELKSSTNGWFWGNILFGGLLGSTTDNVTGAMYEYASSEYLVTLQPKGTSSVEAAVSLSKTQKIKEFIVLNYADLRADLKRGGGSFLSSLLQLLAIPPAEQSGAVKKIGVLSDVYTNVSLFADNVVSTYVKEN